MTVPATRVVLALDIGGTFFRIALADANGVILKQHKEPSNPELGPRATISRIKEEMQTLLSDVDRDSVLGLGIAVAGLVMPAPGILLTSPHMLKWYNTNFKEAFAREPGFPVWVGNDANLAVLGEHAFGAGKGIKDLVYLTVSTGIGAGVLIDGRLLLGSVGFAAELGHTTIDVNGPPCPCGSRGCLDIMASGTGIARMARERLRAGESSVLSDLSGGDPGKVTAVMVEQAARAGDRLAAEVMRTAMTNLGAGIVNIIHAFNPDTILIGGGVSKAGDLLFGPVREVVKERMMPDYRVNIAPAALGDNSGILGAVAHVVESTTGL
ncbi:MAG: ROK family protein [Dehalococcoidia bacterium]|nr:ROK family protein [Dehalococcoidia bacterium]